MSCENVYHKIVYQEHFNRNVKIFWIALSHLVINHWNFNGQTSAQPKILCDFL